MRQASAQASSLLTGVVFVLAVLASLGSAGVASAQWFDNFDSYATGQQLHGVGGWKGWANDPTWGALTSAAQARSVPNSVDIVANADLVHEYAVTDGLWAFTAWQYIPTGSTGESYFILLNQYDDAGATNNWSTQVHFDTTTSTVIADGVGGGASLPLVLDAWVEIKIVIDLVADTQDFYYDGQLLFQGSWSAGVSGGGITSIGAVNLFANGASSVFYDDMSLVEQLPLECNGPPIDFEAGIPVLFSTLTTTGTVYWTTTDDPVGFNNPYECGGTLPGAGADSDTLNVPGDPYDTEMWTNPFSLPAGSAVTLDLLWRHRQLGSSTFDIDISADGGTTWTNLVNNTTGNPSGSAGDAASLDLTPWAGMSGLIVRFRYYGSGWDWYAQVDQLALSCTSGPVVCNGPPVEFDAGIPASFVTATTTGNVYWTTTDDLVGFDNPYECGGTPPGAGADSDTLNQPPSVPYDTEMWTNPFSLPAGSAVTLDLLWRHRQLNSSVFDIDISADGGATWTNLVNDTAGNPSGSTGDAASLDLTPWAGMSDLIVRFRYYGADWDWYAQVDQLELSCTSGPEISLNKTVGTVPGVCATTDEIFVPAGSNVTYCYEVTNTGAVTLDLHDLVDSELGTLFSNLPFILTPGSSTSVTVDTVITSTVVNTATWTAYNPGPSNVASSSDTASVTVVGSAPPDTCADFEGGVLPIFAYAETTSAPPANGRVQVTTAFPHTGTYAVDIDTDCDGCGGSTQQAVVFVFDLAGVVDAVLDLWVFEHGDENNPEDGIFISDDGGATWALIQSLNGFPANYEQVTIDLDAAASGAGMSLVDGFLIKLQSFDNFSLPTDGYSFDDVCVYIPGPPDIDVSPSSLAAAQLPDDVTVQQLNIANNGTGDLNWQIEEENLGGRLVRPAGPGVIPPANQVTIGDLELSTSGRTGPPVTPYRGPTPDALVTITHSASQSIVPGSVACNSGGLHTDNGYLRVFDLPAFGITTDFNVVEVEIAIETATGASGTQSADMNLYLWDPIDPFTYANFTPIGSATTSVPDGATGTIITVPVAGLAPAGSTLVVEFFTPNGINVPPGPNQLFVGSNPDGQTSPSFIAAADCGIPEPTDLAAIGFPNMHIVMNVTGDVAGGLDCAAPSDIPWLSANPITGTVVVGGSQAVDVTFDSTGLMTGIYSGNLCVTSDDPDPGPGNGTDLVVVPVILEVLGIPDIDVDPLSIGSTQPPDTQTFHLLNIDNLGDAALDWQLLEENLGGGNLEFPPMPRPSGPGDPSLAFEDPRSVVPDEEAPDDPNAPVYLWPRALLYDNGPLVNCPGCGVGGADESVMQNTTLGMNILGFGHQVTAGNRVADDFQITDPGGWFVDTITFFAYQTGSTTTSTMTAVNLQIWDGVPGDPGSTVVWGDYTTNVMTSTAWSNIYRVTEATTGGNTDRPIMANVVTVQQLLPPGTYWLDWQTDGSLASGPWAPPITINGQTTTGDGLQSLDNGVTWVPLEDSGTLTLQGLPFIIEGDLGLTECVLPSDIPWLSANPTSGTIPAASGQTVDVIFDSTGLGAGTYNGNLCVLSNDPDPAPGNGTSVVVVPVTLNVTANPAISVVKTVGTTPGVCASTSNITVVAGATVYYCYEVTNTGDVVFTTHDLFDDQLGPIFTGLGYVLNPGASVNTVDAGITASAVINVDTVNTATWTAYDAGGAPTQAQATATVTVEPPNPAITLTKTVGTVPAVCAATSSILVPSGTDVYYCYTVENTGNITFDTHDLFDDQLGVLLSGLPFTLDPGATTEVIEGPVTVNASVVNTAWWTAYAVGGPTASDFDSAQVLVFADTCDDALPLTCPGGGGMFYAIGSTAAAMFTDQGFCGTSHTAPDVWYTITGNGGPMSVTTCSPFTNYDTKVTVWSGSCAAPLCVGGNDDDPSCTFDTLQSTVEWDSVPGETYYIMVHGFSSATGDFELTVGCGFVFADSFESGDTSAWSVTVP